MTLAHSPYARTDPANPRPVGVCDRCGFLYYLDDLVFQRQWAGPGIIKLGIRVCSRTCLDDLQQNGLRTIVIGADPAPLKDARPPSYQTQAGATPVNFILDDPNDGELDDPGVII